MDVFIIIMPNMALYQIRILYIWEKRQKLQRDNLELF